MIKQHLFCKFKPEISKSWVSFINIITVSKTLSELEVTRLKTTQSIEEINIPVSSSINIQENHVELFITDPNLLTLKMQEFGLQLSENVEINHVKTLPVEAGDIYGGLTLPDCTTGFSVINSSGIKGITTAGHCNNDQTYNNIDLPYMGGTTGGIYDIQWNRADLDFVVRNLIWDGTYLRYIYDVNFRSSQFVGEWVCKYGKSSGYACGTISSTDQDGGNIRVDDMWIIPGDSGGPWFWNNTAYGTTISYIENWDGSRSEIYGPVDLIYYILGLKILPLKTYLPLIIK